MLFCCINYRNFEISCHKHFVVVSRYQKTRLKRYCGFRFTSAYNSIKFCSAVSYCLRRCPTKTPGQTPLGHNPPCSLPFVGRLGLGPRLVVRIGSGVRLVSVFNRNTRRVLSYDVLRQQNMTKVVVSGGG